MGTDRKGHPVVPMWTAGAPDPSDAAAGFPVLEGAEHTIIFSPSREEGAYNHHPTLIRHGERFHAFWSNQPSGEDGPGQRILYAQSPDGGQWSTPRVLFEPPGPVKDWHGTGLTHTAGNAYVVDGRLYAIGLLHDNVGFTDFDNRLPPVPARDDAHPSRARKGYSPMAREILPDGEFGPVFCIGPNAAKDLVYTLAPPPPEAESLYRLHRSPEGLTHWDFDAVCDVPTAYDGHRICEPTTYCRPDGQWVMLARDTVYSHRMYVSLLDPETGAWEPAEPTDIPDTPSLSCCLALPAGEVLLVGNQCAPAFDNWDEVQHYNRMPLMVSVSDDGKTFTRAYSLRTGPHPWNVPIAEVGGRGPGYQYPDASVVDKTLWVIYSIGKERIAVSSVELSALGIS